MILAPEHRRPLTEVQRAILRTIVRRVDATGIQPSLAEIGVAVCLGTGSVAYQIGKLEAAGWCTRECSRGIILPPGIREELDVDGVVEMRVTAREVAEIAISPAPLPEVEAIARTAAEEVSRG